REVLGDDRAARDSAPLVDRVDQGLEVGLLLGGRLDPEQAVRSRTDDVDQGHRDLELRRGHTWRAAGWRHTSAGTLRCGAWDRGDVCGLAARPASPAGLRRPRAADA